MKRNKLQLIAISLIVVLISGCLEMNLPDTMDSGENEMTAFTFEYRWITYEMVYNSETGQVVDSIPYLNVKTINTENEIERDSNGSDKITCTLSMPEGIPEKESIGLSNLWGYASVPNAALVTPLDGAPQLGTPGDYSNPVRYLVTAANGDEKEVLIIANGL